MENPADFGTGLRAHLGLERAELELVAEPEAAPGLAAQEAGVGAEDVRDAGALEALAALEAELAERERMLTLREATLASRAGSLLAAAQALYDEVLGGGTHPSHDELAPLRRRKSIA